MHVTGDLFGKFLAIASLAPVFVGVALLTLVAFRRDLQTVYDDTCLSVLPMLTFLSSFLQICFAIGILLNELLNVSVKSVIGHYRPCTGRSHFGNEYGMPSNHSQFTWFFTAYLLAFFFFR